MATSRWRLASRLARREVRLRPGRTMLVALLVASPVFAMTVASVVAHTTSDSWAEEFVLSHGRADLVGQLWDVSSFPSDEEMAAALPPGTTWERSSRVWASARTLDRSAHVMFTDLDVASPLLEGSVAVREGRAPTGADELALDASTARRFGATVGSSLTLIEPAGTWTVTGIVRQEAWWGQRLVVFGDFDWERVAPGNRGEMVYIALPDGSTPETAAAAISAMRHVGYLEARDVPPGYRGADGEVSTNAMAWGWVIGALGLCAVGIIVAAAFATSARRQLVTLGQLSANGADRTLLRRTMALQGSWSGLAGALLGVSAALVALFAFQPWVERLAEKRLGGYEIVARDLVVIALTGVLAATIAALVPAHGTARVPVMAALAGRRPLSAVPRRLVPIGLGLFGGGLFFLMLATTATNGSDGSNNDLYAGVAVVGGLGVLFGMCCLTPLAVDAVGRAGARLSGAWRLSARSLARTRTRSAGVVTAIAAAGALALAGATAFASANAEVTFDEAIPPLPPHAALVTASTWTYVDTFEVDPATGYELIAPEGYRPAAIPESVLDQVASVVGGTTTARRVALWDPAPYTAARDQSRLTLDGGMMVVADPVVLDLVGLSAADRDRLDAVGAVILGHAWSVPDGTSADGPDGSVSVLIDPISRAVLELEAIIPRDPIASFAGTYGAVITPGKAAELGLQIAEDGVFLVAARNLTTTQVRRLQEIQQSVWSSSVFDMPPADDLEGETQVSIMPSYVETEVPRALVNLAIVVAALVFTLAIVGIGLALSAAESRDERDVLVAVGAKPSTMRGVAGQKAVLMALAGLLLAVPTGLLPVVTVVRAARSFPGDMPLVIPWGMVAVLVVGLPVLAGLVSWFGSAVAQRLRPTRMSTLAID